MASGQKRNSFYPILLWTIVLGLTIAAGAIFYKAFQQGTENRTKAAKEGEVYYQWNFNKSASDFLGWYPYNLTLSLGKEKRSSRYLQGIVGEDRTNATLDQNFTDAKTFPVGIKKLAISVSVVPSRSAVIGKPQQTNPTTHTLFMTYKAVETGSKKILVGSGKYTPLFLDGQYHEYTFDLDSLTSFAPTWIRLAWMELPPGSIVKINWIRVIGNSMPLNNMCGGIRGILCPSGYECLMEDRGPDASGTCSPISRPPCSPLPLKCQLSEWRQCVSNTGYDEPLGGWCPLTPYPTTPQAKKCVVTKGCGPDVCAPEGAGVVSICDVRLEYECIKYQKCEMQASGQCGFTQTPESTACLQMFRNPSSDCCSTEKKQQGYRCVKDCAPGNPPTGDYQPPTTYSCLSPDIAAGRERFGCPP